MLELCLLFEVSILNGKHLVISTRMMRMTFVTSSEASSNQKAKKEKNTEGLAVLLLKGHVQPQRVMLRLKY